MPAEFFRPHDRRPLRVTITIRSTFSTRGGRGFPFSSLVLIALAALLTACSLASPAPVDQNSSSGPFVAQPPAAQQPAQPLVMPSRRPSAANGAALYTQKCVGCHGAAGHGDGPSAQQIQQQFGSPVADLTADVTARARTPEQWFTTISNGNLSNGMPPFAGSLDADQRWDVIAYAWTLSTPQAQIDRGKAVYETQCIQCHGATGKGDGKDAQGKLSDFSDFATIAKVEAGAWDQALATTHIPSFAGTLSQDQYRAAVDYLRTFAYDYSGSAPAPSTTPSSSTTGTTTTPLTAPPASTGTNAAINVEGYIVNGTTGERTPGNFPITFYIFPGGTGNTQITHTLQSDAQGHFALTTTQAAHGDLLAATTVYKDLNYFSELMPAVPTVTLPITVYESTPEASAVRVQTMHIVALPSPTGLSVSEIYVLSNTGNKFVAGFGQPVMHFALPKGATEVQVDQSMRPNTLEVTNEGLDYFDGIMVGQSTAQVIFQYTLPGSSFTLDRPINYNVDSVNLLIGGDVSQAPVTSPQLTSTGMQTIQGQTYQQYAASNLTPGQTLTLQIGNPNSPINWQAIAPIAGILLIVVGVAGIFVWQRGRMQPATTLNIDQQRDALIDQIAALDDDFAAGKIDEINYKAKRAKMKDKLIKLMSNEF